MGFLVREGAIMAVGDAECTRLVMRELNRRYVDYSQVDVRVIHGVVYMRGLLKRLRNHPEVDLEREAELIRKILRQRPEIRAIVWEVGTAN